MIKLATCGLAILVLIALSMAIRQKWFHAANPHVMQTNTQSKAASKKSNLQPTPAVRSSASLSNPYLSHDAMSDHLSTSSTAGQLASTDATSADPSAAWQQNDDGELSSDMPVDTGEEDPNAVIGRPFTISPSVLAACTKIEKKASCDNEVTDSLKEMSLEPRDLVWAKTAETKLRDLVLSKDVPFEIRAIECRTSLCVIEVASVFGPFYENLGVDKWLNENLSYGIGMSGGERDPSNARITVSLLTFRRR